MYKKCLQFGHPKKKMNIAKKCAKYLQDGEEYKCREINCLYSKENHITWDKVKCNEYRKELEIMKKMMPTKQKEY